jgi:hypothetical protein
LNHKNKLQNSIIIQNIKSYISGWAWWLELIILFRRSRLGGLQYKDSPDKKFMTTYVNIHLGTVVHACHPSYVESITRIAVQVSPAIKQTPISKLTNTKRAGRVWLKG